MEDDITGKAPPEIQVLRSLWEEIAVEAWKASGEAVGFALYARRRKRPFQVEAVGRLEIDQATGRFRKMKGHYLDSSKTHLRYAGPLLIRQNLELTLKDAYWTGREKVNFRILVKTEGGQLVWKAYWLDPATGDFYPTDLRIVENFA